MFVNVCINVCMYQGGKNVKSDCVRQDKRNSELKAWINLNLGILDYRRCLVNDVVY